MLQAIYCFCTISARFLRCNGSDNCAPDCCLKVPGSESSISPAYGWLPSLGGGFLFEMALGFRFSSEGATEKEKQEKDLRGQQKNKFGMWEVNSQFLLAIFLSPHTVVCNSRDKLFGTQFQWRYKHLKICPHCFHQEVYSAIRTCVRDT